MQPEPNRGPIRERLDELLKPYLPQPTAGTSGPPKFDPSQPSQPIGDQEQPGTAGTEFPDPEAEALAHLRALAKVSPDPALPAAKKPVQEDAGTQGEPKDNGISRWENAKNSFAQGALKGTTDVLQAADRVLPDIAPGAAPLHRIREYMRKKELEQVQLEEEFSRLKRARKLLFLVREGKTTARKSLEIMNKTEGEYQHALDALAGSEKAYQDFKAEIPETYKTNPKYQGEFFASTLPHMAGSAVPVVGSSVLGGPAGAAGAGMLSTNQEIYDEARAKGYTREQAERVALIGTPLGAVDGIGLGRLKVASSVKNRFAKDLLQHTAEEAVGIPIQRIGKDILAKHTYDPDREVGKNIGQEVLSGVALTAASRLGKAGLEQLRARYKPMQTAAPPVPTPAEVAGDRARREEFDEIEKRQTEAAEKRPPKPGDVTAPFWEELRNNLSDPALQQEVREMAIEHLRTLPTDVRRRQIREYQKTAGSRKGKEVTFEEWYANSVVTENQKWAKRKRDISAHDGTPAARAAAYFRQVLYGVLNGMDEDFHSERQRLFQEWMEQGFKKYRAENPDANP